MIWPYEHLKDLTSTEKREGLKVFVLSKFDEKNDLLFKLYESVCAHLTSMFNIEVKVFRVDSSSEPGIIHDDIWNGIRYSDAVLANITDYNENVMYELGVASSIRNKDSVIIVSENKKESECYKPIFDIAPVRHILYETNLLGLHRFEENLRIALSYALTPAPYIPEGVDNKENPPEMLDAKKPEDAEYLLGPANGHRRLTKNGLEFGSFFVFPYSWLTFGNELYDNMKIDLKIRFTEFHPNPEETGGWIGINLRSTSPFANFGHLIYVHRDASLKMTVPVSEDIKEKNDSIIGNFENISLDQIFHFELTFNEKGISGNVSNQKENIPVNIPINQMKFVHHAGQIRIQSYQNRACIESISVKRL